MKVNMTKKAWIIIVAAVLAVGVAVGVIIALIPHKHRFGEGTVDKEPTCTESGSMSYTCSSCGEVKTEEIPAKGHSFSEWRTLVEHTPNAEGLERRDCSVCGFYEERTLSKIPAKYYITIDKGLGGVLYWGVSEDGIYSIEDPVRAGYKFIGWFDEEGKPFPSKGTVTEHVNIYARWELLDTNTLAELRERAEGGADLIRLTSDIVIDSPVYVTGKTRIFSEKPIKLTRAKNYNGDLFVVGQTEDGESSIVKFGKAAELTLGKDEWTSDSIMLTVDGNSDNTEVDVVGSAFFLIYGGNFNMYDGVSIVNHKKVGNERSYNAPKEYIGTGKTIGGAVAIVGDGSAFHMYGGVIENNSVNTTSTTDENGEAVNLSGYGGVIYNNGTVRIHKGTVSNNQANRGGVVYSNGVVKIYAGVFENNYAGNKGGAICTSGSLSADTFISSEGAAENTVVFRGNYAGTQGGAILSYYDSPVVIYDGVLFENNKAEKGSGGAISTSGPVTAYNTKFIGNTAKSYGGSIYHAYAGSDAIRQLILNGCTFHENQASSGGAIMLASAKDDSGKGTYAELESCIFTNNAAVSKSGVGGAINVTEASVLKDRGSLYSGNTAYRGGAVCIGVYEKEKKDTVLATFTDSIFTNNKADNTTEESDGKSRGGAIHVAEYVTVEVTDAIFEENFSAQYGGALDLAREATLKVSGATFKNNISRSNGGALWGYTDSVFEIEATEFNGNTTNGYGGAVYAYSTLNVKNSKFIGNDAVNGGALYTVAGMNVADSEFNNNTVHLNNVTSTKAVYLAAGSAIYAAKGSNSTVSGCKFESNAAYVPETSSSSDTRIYGGAVCVYGADAAMTLSGSEFKNNGFVKPAEKLGYTAKTYGGAIGVTQGATVSVTGGSTFSGNSAMYGGAFAAATNSKAKIAIDTATFTENNATNCGGAIYLNAAAAELKNVVANKNRANSTGGGAIYASGCNGITVEDSVFEENTTGNAGGAFSVSTAIDIRNTAFTKNEADKKGGAIYASSTVNVSNCTFTENTSEIGGAICVNSGTTSTVGCTFTGNTATSGGAVYVAENATYKDGIDTTVEIEGVSTPVQNSGSEFIGNTATNGGAIYVAEVADPEETPDNVAGKAVIEGATFKKNIAATNGGAIFLDKAATLNDTDSLYEENTAYRGGAIYVSVLEKAKKDTVVVTVDGSTFRKNAANATESATTARGGAIYVAEYVTVEITGAAFEENSAKQYGGAISVARESTLNVSDSKFTKNTSGTNGGVFWGYTDAVLNIEKSEFSENTTGTNGGAVYAYTTLNITDSTFTANGATNGGAVYLVSGDADINGCTFANNTATNGGAIYVAKKSIDVSNSSFTGNTADENGGAVYVIDATVTVTDTDFTENEAGTRGGAITAENVVLTVNGGTMKENKVTGGATSSYYGGALDARAKTQATITGTVFDGNVAYSGGAISSYATGTSVTLNQVELKNNVGNNGAIYIGSAASVTVTDLNAHDNATKSKGAVFYMTSGSATTLTVNSATLSNNTANKVIGFIFISNAKNVLNINKSKVTGSDVNNNWDKLILNSNKATVNELA